MSSNARLKHLDDVSCFTCHGVLHYNFCRRIFPVSTCSSSTTRTMSPNCTSGEFFSSDTTLVLLPSDSKPTRHAIAAQGCSGSCRHTFQTPWLCAHLLATHSTTQQTALVRSISSIQSNAVHLKCIGLLKRIISDCDLAAKYVISFSGPLYRVFDADAVAAFAGRRRSIYSCTVSLQRRS